MRRILNFFKSRKVIITIGFLSLIVLIWVILGVWLKLGAVVCLLATCVVLLLLTLYLFFERSAEAKRSDQLERSIWEQSEDQKMNVRPERREEIEVLRQQLSASIQKLKSSKLGHGKRGAAALYALPWYMIIGPPAAGKTTVIKNSGLEFPFGTDHEIQGVGGTRNCDWWFSNSAIVLDTAGRYTTEEDDQQEWFAFLDTLKKNRRRQPINGVLICISIAELLNASVDELEWHAKTVRKRMDELTQRLGLRFPVYLVFTKCDLLNGFVEFFEEFSRLQRETIWGCTFSKEQLDDANPKSTFEREFQVLYDALIDMRLARLSPGIKHEQRALIFAFPMEFLSAKENLSFFVGKVFQPNPYQESPLFRGFYFTSGTQEGVPIDKVIQSLANAFGLTADTAQQFNPEMQTKSYFIRDLFTDIIIPDNRLVRLNSRSARNRRLLKVGVISAAAAGLLLFVLGVTLGYFRSKTVLEETANRVDLLKSPAAASMSATDKLNILLDRLNVLQDPPFFVFGMDRSGSLLGPMRKQYFRQLYPFIENSVLRPLQESFVRGEGRGGAYFDLKAYLLLTLETDRLKDQENQRFLYSQLTKMLDPNTASAMKPHIAYLAQWFAETVSDSIVRPFPADMRAIAAARFSAGRLDIGNIYDNLKRKVSNVAPFTVSDPSLRAKNELAGVYTMEGAAQIEQLIDDGEFANLSDEARWVLGTQNNQMPGVIADQSQVADSLRKVYYREYADAWWNFLEGIEVVPFENLEDAAARMKQLSDSRTSPIKKLLEGVVMNTRFEGQSFKSLRDKAKKKIERIVGSTMDMHPVDRDFKGLHAFVGGSPDKKSDLDEAISQLAPVSDELDRLMSQQPRDAKDLAQKVLSGSVSLQMREVRRVLKDKDDRMKRAITGLFEQPIRNSWKAILAKTMDYLNDQWSQEVVKPYSQLSTYYPFDTNSSNDAPLSEVGGVFAPNGKLWAFVEKDLRPFVDEAERWDPIKWEGVGLELSPDAKNALLQARVLSGSLFRGGDVGMKVNVRMELPIRSNDSKDFDKVCLMIGGKVQCLVVEEGKPASFSFDWPGEGGGAAIRLVRERGKTLGLFGSASDETVEELRFDGGWGLFRLVAMATRMPASSMAEYRCRWTFKDHTLATCVLGSDKGFNNPFKQSFTFGLPAKLN